MEPRCNWVKGRHTLAFGMLWDHTQLNIINNNTNTDTIDFKTFENFVEGAVRTGIDSTAFTGSANRYYRSNTAGAFVNDNYKVRSNLTVTLGLRWDFDGPLSEKYGRLTAFNGNHIRLRRCHRHHHQLRTRNSPKAASDSLMKNRQWGFAPRIGIAWTPIPKLTVRTGFGIYYDRGEFFSYLSPSAGGGFNGPFGVTLEPPFVQPIVAQKGATFSAPFGTTPPASADRHRSGVPGSAAKHLPDRVRRFPRGKPVRTVPVRRLRHQQQTALHRELDVRSSIPGCQ